jgi:RNA polymerase sigma factor (sigma-70 family)
MEASTNEEPPPDSTDFAGWKRAAEQKLLLYLPLEAIAAALQDIRFNTDSGLRNALAKALSDRTYKLLRRQVGRNHPNTGTDIIDRVHLKVFEALARPDSADAKGYRQAFVARLMFRLKDAIAKEARERRIPDEIIRPAQKSKQDASMADEPLATGGQCDSDDRIVDEDDATPSKSNLNPALLDGVRATDQQIDIDRFLETNISDDRKRLAFRLFMDEVPFKSIRSDSIAKALGIDEATARQWIEEIRTQLKKKIGELS